MPRCVTESTDLAAAEALWRKHIPQETIFDLWEVRIAFHHQFQRPFRLLHAEEGPEKLFLPLSWVEERQAWCCFPGETWHAKTWLEQNRPLLGGLDAAGLRNRLGADLHLRYLIPGTDGASPYPFDEIGYLFHPPRYQYQMENWWNSFSHKRVKLLRRELAELEGLGMVLRQAEAGYFERLLAMNLERFGTDSFFNDHRFCEGFRGMIDHLDRMGLLRVTSLYLGGQLAAVDVGSVYNGRYTLLARGISMPAIYIEAARVNGALFP